MNRVKLTILSACALVITGLREQFSTANASTATAQGTHPGPQTFRVDAALTKTHLLVKAGTDERHVAICGAADYPVGLAIGEAEAAEDTVGVEPLASGQTSLFRCATALAANIDLYTAANGYVQAEPGTAGTFYKVGRSKRLAVIEATSEYHIEAEPCYPVPLVVAAAPATVGNIATAMAGATLVKFLPLLIAACLLWFGSTTAQAAAPAEQAHVATLAIAQIDQPLVQSAPVHHPAAFMVIDLIRDEKAILGAIALALAAGAYLPKKYRSLGAFFRYLKKRARDVCLWFLRVRLILRSLLGLICAPSPGYCTANAQLALSTSNAAIVAHLMASASVPSYEKNEGRLEHELITTANASLFQQAHFSEPFTQYALGWKDPAGYDRLSDFVAPPVPGLGERYEHIEYPNAEAFLSDVHADDDLRGIGAEFKTVDYTWSRRTGTIPNRGLRIVLDWDRIKNLPNWQRTYVDFLMNRLMRNGARRKVAIGLAAGVAVSKTWGSTADPDLDVANEAKNSGDITGVSPNRALAGLAAKLLRYSSYGSQATAAGFGGRSMSIEEGFQKIGLEALVDESRYQSGTSKTAIVGSKVLLFSAYGMSGMDPSNFKTARGVTSQGGRFAVYIRQVGVKFWEITVECYETEWVASTLGVRTITVS